LRLTRLISLLATAAVLPIAVAGCGNDVPSGAVAKVDDTVIKQEEFDHWVQAAAQGQQPPGAGGQVSVPDPPDFTECVDAKKQQPVPPGSQKPTDDQLKDQCQQEFDSLKQQVMQFLISAEWIEQEANARDIEVSDEEVQKQFEDQKNQSFPNEKQYQQFLKTSGQTEEDLLFRVKLDVLSTKVRDEIIDDVDEVSDEDIQTYYDENKERFAQPERRDLNVVLTKTEDKANEAKQAIESGQSFKDVAKEFSIDEASKSQGGKLPAVAEGQQEKAFNDAIFAADKGELTGPVKTQFGWYVFKVDKVNKASQQSLEDAKTTIKQVLASQNQQKALDAFVKDFRKRWKQKTDCREGYRTQDCKNAPKPTPTPTPAAPGQAAPTQTPAQ
jgi:foldase protein PrsA